MALRAAVAVIKWLGSEIFGAKKIWKNSIDAVMGDGRLCFSCWNLNDEEKDLTDPWVSAKWGVVMSPPLHPWCRCHYVIQPGGDGPAIPIYSYGDAQSWGHAAAAERRAQSG